MVEEKIEELNEAIRQFGETSAELKHNFAEVKQEVSETAKRMIEKIQERERVVIESPRGDAQEERKEDYLGWAESEICHQKNGASGRVCW